METDPEIGDSIMHLSGHIIWAAVRAEREET